MKILIMCGAGASSTFVALRVRTAAADRGIDASVSAGALSQLSDGLDGVDVVLLGPHLADRFEEIRQLTNDHGVVAVQLPDDVFAPDGGGRALDLALGAAAPEHHP